jgi:UDP-glucuronate decarboxylase
MTNAKTIIEDDIQYIIKNCSDEFDKLSGQTVLLTGGAGFFGYLFLHTLSTIGATDGRDPIELIVCDNFFRGYPRWLQDFRDDKLVEVLEHDVGQPLPESLRPIDYIIHAASIASPSYYRMFPIQTIDANVNGVRQLLNYSLSRTESGHPINGMLFFSTSEIYGDPSPGAIPTPEDYRGFVSCTGPRACYDESKRLGETLCVNFFQQHKIPVKTVRPFNNYGPGLSINDGRVLSDFAKNIFDNKDVVLFSDGSPTRTFCYIADAITGYLKVLINGRAGEAYNIGTTAPEITMSEFGKRVVDTARELFNYQGSIVFEKSKDAAYLTDSPNRRCPDVTKATTELGYDPKISVADGIRRTLLWYQDNRS